MSNVFVFAPPHILRYGLVGSVALALDVGVFALLRGIGADLITANVMARFAGAATAFAGNHGWTFGNQTRDLRPTNTALRYAFLWLAATALSTTVLALATSGHQQGNASEAVLKAFVECGMVAINYIVCKRWVFR